MCDFDISDSLFTIKELGYRAGPQRGYALLDANTCRLD
jgi:hypothetical protein